MATEGTETRKRLRGHDAEVVRLCEQVRETSFAIHRFLRHGHLEKVYEKALDAHAAQVLGYLRASRIEHALLINFGAPVIQFRKFILDRIPESPVFSVPSVANSSHA